MSLINDALKKAQRQRAEPPAAGDLGAAASAARVEKRGQAMRSQTLILLVAAAAVLVVLSVVATVYLLSGPSPSSRPAPNVARTPSATPETASPVIVLPVAPPLVGGPAPAPTGNSPAALAPPPVTAVAAPTAASENPSAAPVATKDADAGPRPSSPVVAENTPSTLAEPSTLSASPAVAARAVSPPAPGGPDARIQGIVDAIRVTGIRSSGSDSKVLMNDRVYRVNDIVDRTLGLRLVKVETDKLSFIDANGTVYTKDF